MTCSNCSQESLIVLHQCYDVQTVSGLVAPPKTYELRLCFTCAAKVSKYLMNSADYKTYIAVNTVYGEEIQKK